MVIISKEKKKKKRGTDHPTSCVPNKAGKIDLYHHHQCIRASTDTK
jgi:hypothetical protein